MWRWRTASDQTCPVHALSQWLHYARIDFGPLFVAVSRNGLRATQDRLSDKHVARLIKQTVAGAGLRPDLPEAERIRLYSGHSLRAGLASSAEVDARHVQKQLGHASAEMTRRYQRRRDRFRVNLSKAAGLRLLPAGPQHRYPDSDACGFNRSPDANATSGQKVKRRAAAGPRRWRRSVAAW